jgi:stage III sporulation protein AH
MAYYQAIVDSSASTTEEVSNAKASMLDLVSQIEKELYVEGLIKGIGFDDCVMTLTPSNINVVVKSSGLNETEVAQIVTILQEQLSASLENIKIMPIA